MTTQQRTTSGSQQRRSERLSWDPRLIRWLEFRRELADRSPELGKQRLARTRLELRGRNAFQRHDPVADDAESETHVRVAPLQKRLVVIHHRLDEMKQVPAIARL